MIWNRFGFLDYVIKAWNWIMKIVLWLPDGYLGTFYLSPIRKNAVMYTRIYTKLYVGVLNSPRYRLLSSFFRSWLKPPFPERSLLDWPVSLIPVSLLHRHSSDDLTLLLSEMRFTLHAGSVVNTIQHLFNWCNWPRLDLEMLARVYILLFKQILISIGFSRRC